MAKRAHTALVLMTIGLASMAARAAPPPFRSRVPYQPLVAKLKASGGDPSRILHLRSGGDLLRLERGNRYKFVLETSGTIAIAPMPADAPHNEYVHPILAGGRAVSTAGGIVVELADSKVTEVTLDQDSKAYCPTLQSLEEAARVLEKLGVMASRIFRQDRPPACVAGMN